MQFTDVATIEKTYERAKAENLGVSKTALRRWCKDGTLKTVHTGTKYLIYWPNLLNLLQNGADIEQAPEYGKIRRIG